MYLQLSFFCSSLTCFNPNTLPLLKLVVKSPLTATPNGVQLGYKQFSIIVTMEFIWFASLSFAPSLFYSTFRIIKKRSKCIGFHHSYLKFWCESICNPKFLPTLNYHFFHSLDLCSGCMNPHVDCRFEVVHLQINV
jgi:hypothetical protein